MLIDEELIFNNVSCQNFNLILNDYPLIPQSNEDYEEIEVEGRIGNLILKKGTYRNRTITVTFTKINTKCMFDYDRIYDWLTNIYDNRMFFGRRDRTYIVKNVVIGDIKEESEIYGEFQVSFLCEPFVSDVYENEYTITQSGFSFYYDGTAPSDPLVNIYGTGNIQFNINDETMQIRNMDQLVTIDSELLQVRDKNGQSKDFDTTGDFIALEKGYYHISYTGNISKVEFKFTTKYK